MHLRRLLYRVQDNLVRETVLERRLHGTFVRDGIDEVGNRVYERVLVTDDVARWPPVADVGVYAAALRDQNVAESAPVRRIGIIVILQSVHGFQIKHQRALTAVYLDLDAVLASKREPRGLQIRQRAIRKPSYEKHRVMYI